ncbi:hypothetical protein [Effusibacillus consociatus]|uniref:Permease n=1 Tax=Effusibacillus consociatus TaxID=1117041 RepID=A0ABV9Q7S7_9BACL
MGFSIKKWVQEVCMVMLLCSFVILANVLIGWMVILTHYSFYMAVFFFLFIPVWLFAFGLVFHSKWKWYFMLPGSFLAGLFLCFTFFIRGEDLSFRILNALLLASIGSLSVLGGWAIRELIHSIRKVFANKKGKQRSEEHPTSLGL